MGQYWQGKQRTGGGGFLCQRHVLHTFSTWIILWVNPGLHCQEPVTNSLCCKYRVFLSYVPQIAGRLQDVSASVSRMSSKHRSRNASVKLHGGQQFKSGVCRRGGSVTWRGARIIGGSSQWSGYRNLLVSGSCDVSINTYPSVGGRFVAHAKDVVPLNDEVINEQRIESVCGRMRSWLIEVYYPNTWGNRSDCGRCLNPGLPVCQAALLTAPSRRWVPQ
jgi:hypothetical protein